MKDISGMSNQRNLGGLGEKTLDKLCQEEGIVATRPGDDLNGWDFHLEFPQDRATCANEIHRSPYECRVQVKSSDKRDGKQQIKLSNLHRACTTLLPVFILIFEFDGGKDAQRAYLVHLDNFWVSAVLKQVHELNQTVPRVPLHKSTMTVTYGSHHLLPEITGKAVADRIRNEVGKDFAQYVIKKKEYLASVGYEKGAFEFKFNIEGDEVVEAFIDSHLGILRKIPIKNIKRFNQRFGIKEPVSSFDSDTGMIEIDATGTKKKGSVSFRQGEFGQKITFDCDLYLGGCNPAFPKEKQRIRIACDLIEIICYPGNDKVDFRFLFDEDRMVPFSEILKVFSLRRIFSVSVEDIRIEILCQEKPDAKFSSIMNGGTSCDVPEPFASAVNAVNDLIKIFDLSPDFDASISKLIEQEDRLRKLVMLLQIDPKRIRMDTECEDPDFFQESASYGAVRSVCVPVGHCYLVFQMIFFGTVTKVEEALFRLTVERVVNEFPLFLSPGEPFSEKYIEKTFSDLKNKYTDATLYLANA